MTKEIIIVVLIIALIYFYSQQNQPSLNIQPNNQEEIQDLKTQVQHYQTLYQKRVAKDLETDQSKKIKQLESNLSQANESNNLFQQKVGDLEKELIAVASKKILVKKESKRLFEKLGEELEQAREIRTNLEQEMQKLTKRNQELDKENELLDQQQNEWYKADFPGRIKKMEQNHQEQLRRINLLFDEKAGSYEKIDFNRLYALMVRFKDEVERERAKLKGDDEVEPIYSRQRKKKK